VQCHLAALEHVHPRPQAFVAGSAIGYYGTSRTATFTESSPPGDDFLGKLCAAWEAASDGAAALGMRVAKLRTGLVLGRDGGVLAKLLPVFRLGVGGAIASGKLADALAAWRDAGGMIELENLRVKWGALNATGTGTIALDQELQPTGGFSGAIQGYDQILTALVQSGQMRASDAGLARIALSFLAKAGPDGKPEIRTAFTIQNGQMFLGPAKLGRVPRITWE